MSAPVTPAQAGAQAPRLGSGFRRNDGDAPRATTLGLGPPVTPAQAGVQAPREPGFRLPPERRSMS